MKSNQNSGRCLVFCGNGQNTKVSIFPFLFLLKMELSVKEFVSKFPAGGFPGCFRQKDTCRNAQPEGFLDVSVKKVKARFQTSARILVGFFHL